MANSQDLQHKQLVQAEITLCMGQANNALHGLRLALTKKAMLFRGLRDASSKTKRNRSWDQIKTVGSSASHHAMIYQRAWDTLISLGMMQDAMAPYQILRKEHLTITTAKIDPHQRGNRNSSLAWFWSMDVQGDSQSVEGMSECMSNH